VVFSSHFFIYYFLPFALLGYYALFRAPQRWRNSWADYHRLHFLWMGRAAIHGAHVRHHICGLVDEPGDRAQYWQVWRALGPAGFTR
jgi:hypothetical protein